METNQSPHEKLTEEKIKDYICQSQSKLVFIKQCIGHRFDMLDIFLGKIETENIHMKESMYQDLHALQEFLFLQLNYLDINYTSLKKHFCPEKFSIMKVSVKELSDMMAYPTTDEVKHDNPA